MASFDNLQNETRIAIQALFQALGKPDIDNSQISEITDVSYGTMGLHPVFPLTEHFRSYDNRNKGYTHNLNRGDHISIPAFTEDGEVVVLDLSFHKGATTITYVTFPNGSSEIKNSLYDLLVALETR